MSFVLDNSLSKLIRLPIKNGMIFVNDAIYMYMFTLNVNALFVE